MPTRFLHAALIGKYQAQGILPLLQEIAQFLQGQGVKVSIDRETAKNTGWNDHRAMSPAEMGAHCDLAIVVGGDGTMLGIARELAAYNLPMVGINQGRLGFITDVSIDQWREALTPMIRGDYEEESRAMLEGDIWRLGEKIYAGFAFNDVVVSRGATATMVELKVDVGDEFIANLRADGLIIGSPTGSTAYALSAGGPILHPAIGGWVMVPIAPHTLSNRPIVLPDNQEITIGIVAARDASANFDMQAVTSLMVGDEVCVRRSPQKVRFLHPLGWSYYATLRRKLRWQEGVT
jgi:NAD+ kinase